MVSHLMVTKTTVCAAGHRQEHYSKNGNEEVFVLQTAGRKRWRLHVPVRGQLPAGPNNDRCAGSVGPFKMDVILEASAHHLCPCPSHSTPLMLQFAHIASPAVRISKWHVKGEQARKTRCAAGGRCSLRATPDNAYYGV